MRDEFRFHMTLTGPVSGTAEEIRDALDAHLALVLGRPLPLDGLGLFVEPEPGSLFRVTASTPSDPSSRR